MPSSALKKKKKYKIYFFICFSFHLLYFSSLFIQIALVPTIFPYTTLFRSMVTLPAPPASWHVITTGDFNGDGHSDLLWQNDNGTPLIWTMNGANVVAGQDRKSTRLNSSHRCISYAVFCFKKKKKI